MVECLSGKIEQGQGGREIRSCKSKEDGGTKRKAAILDVYLRQFRRILYPDNLVWDQAGVLLFPSVKLLEAATRKPGYQEIPAIKGPLKKNIQKEMDEWETVSIYNS